MADPDTLTNTPSSKRSGASVKPTQRLVRGCQLFKSRPVSVHIGVFLGGIMLWIGTYLLFTFLTGQTGLVAADSAAGVHARLLGAGVAGGVTGVYFAAAYMSALGSPMLNVLFPSLLTVAMPGRIYTLFEPVPEPLHIAGMVETSLFLGAGSIITLIVVIGWYRHRFGSMGGSREWEKKYFPAGFSLAMAAADDARIDWEQADYGIMSHEGSYLWTGVKHGGAVLLLTFLFYGIILGLSSVFADPVLLLMFLETPFTLIAISFLIWMARLQRNFPENQPSSKP